MIGVDFKPCRDPATHHGGKKWAGIKTGERRMETKLLHLSLRGQLRKQWDWKALKEKRCRSCYKRECGRVKKQNEQISTRPGAHPTLHNEAESREDRKWRLVTETRTRGVFRERGKSQLHSKISPAAEYSAITSQQRNSRKEQTGCEWFTL